MRDEMTARLEVMMQNQEKMEANLKEIRPSQEHLKRKVLVKLDAHHERIMARMDSYLEKMEVSLGKMETMDFEVNSKEKESKAQHEEVSKEEATVETLGALKKLHGDWHLAVGRHGKLKE
jgi:hypothetical protein